MTQSNPYEPSIHNFLYIQRPIVEENTVFFEWNLDYDEQKSVNNIYIDYCDLDISLVPLQVHYNTIIGLLLNKLRSSAIPTIVVTQDTILEDIAKFWVSYHNLKNVYFSNTENAFLSKYHISSSEGSVGILYGGGKDSYCALDILSKNTKIKQVNLISFVIPDTHVNIQQLEERRDNLILSPISNQYNINVFKIKTNARAVIKGYHLELYFAPLGVLAWLNLFEYITFSYEYCHYFVPLSKGMGFGFERSQVAHIQNISNFYSYLFSHQPVTIFNANQHLSELSGFGYLSKNNADFYKTLVMCESTVDVNQKWCCSCTKCAEFVLFSEFYNLGQSDIDINWFFSESSWINKVIDELKQSEKKGPFFKGLTFTLHFDSFKFVITKLKDRGFAFQNRKAQNNFDLLVEHYYDRSIRSEDCFYTDILNQVYPPSLKQETFALLKAVLPDSLAPNKKSSGMGTLSFNADLQPEIYQGNVKISSADFYTALTNKNRFPKLNNDPLNAYIQNYKVKTLGTLAKANLSVDVHASYCDVWIDKNPPMKDEGYEISLTIPVAKSFNYCRFRIEIPHLSAELDSRFSFSVTVNGKTKPVSLAEHRNVICQFAIENAGKTNGFISIQFSVQAVRNLEPWRWGAASRIILSDIKLYETQILLDYEHDKFICNLNS
ncbi:hypothetical protein [Neisseria zoodegmatis]|uniref:UDP-N-acetyl-alpha-D-muramoyl-L-alanyl-L-glutamate epimerase n=1 Tax=Neisseria zoodegmatis TaxID=326523 RepID=A0AB38DTV9_9NEIS|nr:hypothetical protein [Neisseria zoodegmatis]OSI10200.1 hypothetical protein BWD10_05730 [Neisseria zoodegmatis]SNU80803.1 Uncharacterised protein [Neisseria zoodegmatis]